MKNLVFPALLLFGTASFALAETAVAKGLPTESYELNQCAIIQVGTHPRVFLTNLSGELEALDGAIGKVLWHKANGGFPLLARGNRLLVAVPPEKGKAGYDLALFDVRDGKRIKRLANPTNQPIEGVGEGLGRSYYLHGITQDGHDVLVWTLTWCPTPGGAYKGPDFVYPPGSSGQKEGLFVVDMAGGNLLPPSGFFPNISLRGQTNPWGGYSVEPFKVEDITAQAVMDMVNNQDHLTLRRWKGSDALPDVQLGTPPWNSCGIVVCEDHQEVLGIWQVPEKKDPFLYHIGVFSTLTGEKTAEVDATSWPSKAQLCENDLVCYFPNRVFAMDISTGKEVWSQQLKDLTYHGPYPPAVAPGRPMAKPQENE